MHGNPSSSPSSRGNSWPSWSRPLSPRPGPRERRRLACTSLSTWPSATDGACMASTACQNPSLTYMALTARACAYAVDALKRGDL